MLEISIAAPYSPIQIDFKHAKWFLNCNEHNYKYFLGI